jgi:hyperosmotically inducible protein
MNKLIPALLLGVGLAASACVSGSGGYRPATATGAPMDDATITARVKTALLNDTEVNATQIDVSTSAGIVTISGSVKTPPEAARAVAVARTITGVRDVKSALQVQP